MTTPPSLRIMIVEDDRAIGEVLRNVVDEVPGWEATVVGDGRGALDTLHAQPMDVLLIDVNLPDTTGPQLLERVRCQPGMAGAPAIFMSAAGLSAAVQTALHRGEVVAFVAKPFDLDDVVDLLEQTASTASSADPEKVSGMSDPVTHSGIANRRPREAVALPMRAA